MIKSLFQTAAVKIQRAVRESMLLNWDQNEASVPV